MTQLSQMTKKDLLALPDMQWDAEKWWAAILVIPLRTRHESGYANIATVGVDREQVAREVICRYSDDIELPSAPMLGGDYQDLRMDCLWPSGVLKLWSRRYEFQVFAGSSLTIQTRQKPATMRGEL